MITYSTEKKKEMKYLLCSLWVEYISFLLLLLFQESFKDLPIKGISPVDRDRKFWAGTSSECVGILVQYADTQECWTWAQHHELEKHG